MTGSNVRSLEQLSLETAFEWRQRWTWCDRWRKAVPCLSHRHRKCTTTECLPLKARDDETGRRSGPMMPSWLDLRHTDEFVGKVARPSPSIGQHRQFVLDPLRKPQSVQITDERYHVLGSTSSVDQSGSRDEHGPQPVRQAICMPASVALPYSRRDSTCDTTSDTKTGLVTDEQMLRSRRSTAKQPDGHQLRDMSTHADVAVQINPEVSDWRRLGDIVPDTQTGLRKLMLTSNGYTPEHFRLGCVQLKTIRLHRFCNVIKASRNLLLQLQGIRWRWVAADLCVDSIQKRNEVMPFDEPP